MTIAYEATEYGATEVAAASANRTVDELLAAVDALGGAPAPDDRDAAESSALRAAIRDLHRTNLELWAEEDEARRRDATDTEIGAVKRAIDRLNLRRHRFTEAIDDALLPALPDNPYARPHTETPGMIVDRLSVLILREYHTAVRHAADRTGRFAAPLASVRQQLSDLRTAFELLLRSAAEGDVRFHTYRAHKLYGGQT